MSELVGGLTPVAEAGDDGEPGEPGDVIEDEPEDGEEAEREPRGAATGQTETEAMEESRKLGKAATNYQRRVAEILGPDLAGWIPCELCDGFPPGLRAPIEVTEPKLSDVRRAIGLPDLSNYRADTFSATCAECDGHGIVLTGSRLPGRATIQCLKCQGRGWVPVGPERAIDTLPAPTGAQPVERLEDQQEAPPVDPWGRPIGHPDYYRMPIPGVTT